MFPLPNITLVSYSHSRAPLTNPPCLYLPLPTVDGTIEKNSCVSRLGYDLEGKCKDIAARKKARGNGGSSGGRAGGRSSPTSGKRSATAAAGRGDGGGGSSRSAVAPNYTSESVIEDIYGGVAAQQTGTGSRDRATRASRRSASSVSYGWRLGLCCVVVGGESRV